MPSYQGLTLQERRAFITGFLQDQRIPPGSVERFTDKQTGRQWQWVKTESGDGLVAWKDPDGEWQGDEIPTNVSAYKQIDRGDAGLHWRLQHRLTIKEPTPPPPVLSPEEQSAQDRLAQEQSNQRKDAFARVLEVLNSYGLGSLSGFVWDNLIEGRSENEITQRIRESPEYKVRFAGMEERRRKGLTPISEAEYVDYEKNAQQMMRRAGLPPGFYDSKADITQFIAGDVSLAELNDRVNLAKQAVFEVPNETRTQLQRMYGVGPEELAAFFIDPDVAEPLIKKRFTASQIAGASQRTGFGELQQTEAERLASLGITEEQAQQGFGQLTQANELFQDLPGERDGVIDRAEQIGAAFEGDVAAQARIEKKRSQRKAEYQRGGGFASTQGGVSGLGS